MKPLALISLFALIASGCAHEQKLFGPSLMPRAQAAEAITEASQRDEALRTVALDAIRDGDAVVANEAIDAIRDPRVKDDAAARCAQWLAKNWRAGEATAIAKKITDVPSRDRVLVAIALGRP